MGRAEGRDGAWKVEAGTRWVHLRTPSLVPYAKAPAMQRKEILKEWGSKPIKRPAPKQRTFQFLRGML